MEKNKESEGNKGEKITDQIGYFKYAFENAQKLAEFADSKASTLLTIHAVIVTILAAAMFIEGIHEKINSLIDLVLIFFIFVLLVTSAYFAIDVIKPREAGSKESLFYYQKIADHEDENEYYRSFGKLTSVEISKAFANQAFEVSKIANKKMQNVRYSLYFLLGYLITLIFGSLIIFAF